MLKRYSRAPSLFFDTPLALLPAKRDEIIAFWDVKLRGGALEWSGEQAPAFEAEIVAESEIDDLDLLGNGPAQEPKRGKIAILPLHGVISQRMNMMTAMSGGTSTDMFAQEFLKQLHDPEIKGIIIDIDSPGGSTFGVTELANLIMESRGEKPILAFASPIGASAAYWVGAAADYFFAEPSALVGSVGVYTVHTDLSRAAEDQGVKVTFISAGENKTRGNEYEPLSEDDVEYLQSIVDDAYGMFIGDVARGRRVSRSKVLKEFGRGDVFTATKALEVGMIDGIKNNLGEVVTTLSSLRPRRATPRSIAAAEEDEPRKLTGRRVEESAEPKALIESEHWHFAGPIPPHTSSSIAADDAQWNPEKEVAAAQRRSELRRMHAWVDEDGDPDSKDSYKGLHHRANGQLVPQALALAAKENLESDPGIRRHLARHYRELDRTPPWEEEEQQARARNWRYQQWLAQKARAETISALHREEE